MVPRRQSSSLGFLGRDFAFLIVYFCRARTWGQTPLATIIAGIRQLLAAHEQNSELDAREHLEQPDVSRTVTICGGEGAATDFRWSVEMFDLGFLLLTGQEFCVLTWAGPRAL